MHKVYVIWQGVAIQRVNTYMFDTQAELNAFVYGVTETDLDGELHDFYETEADAQAALDEENDE